MDSPSHHDSNEEATWSDTQITHPTSSSSLGLSSGEESEVKRGIMRRSLGLSDRPGREEISRVIEKLAADANRELLEIERRRKGKSVETRGSEETQGTLPNAMAKEPQDNPIREIYDLTGTDDEETTAPDRWRKNIEATVEKLVAVSTTHDELLKSHQEQIIKVVDLADSMVAWMGGASQSPNQPSLTRATPLQQVKLKLEKAKKARTFSSSGGQKKD